MIGELDNRLVLRSNKQRKPNGFLLLVFLLL